MSNHWSDELGDFQTHAEYPSSSVLLVGVCKLELFFPSSHSLKEKRQHLLRVKQKVEARFKVPISEVGWKDKWQRTTLGFAVVGDDRGHVQERLDKIVAAIEMLAVGESLDIQMEILSF